MSALSPGHLLKGQLVRLAAQHEDDKEVLSRWTHDIEYLRLVDDDPALPQSPDAFRFPTKPPKDAFVFHIRTLADDKFIGFVALHTIKGSNRSAMLSIGIGEAEYRGKGYGTDAIRLILAYAFRELNLHRVGLTVLSYNINAIRLYESLGFVREGVTRECVARDGQWHDIIHMGMLYREWQHGNGSHEVQS